MNGSDTLPEIVGKGKRRAAEPTEHTPLLVSSSTLRSSPSATYQEAEPPAASNRRLRRKLTTVFLLSLSVCIVGFVLLGLLAWSYVSRVSALDPDLIIHQDLAVSGPDRVDVLSVSSSGIWLNITGRMGIDAGKAIGVGTDEKDNLLDGLWKAFGRWTVQTLDRVAINMTTVRVAPEYDPTETLLYLEVSPIELPLTVDPPKDPTWLTPISSPVFVKPTSNTTILYRFLKESWRTGKVSVRAHVGQAVVRGGSLDALDWRSKFSRRLVDIRTSVSMNIPLIPGFPAPGPNAPFPAFAELVTLTSFSVTSESDTLSLHGTATVINPVPSNLDFSGPSLPFHVSITNASDFKSLPIHVASISSHPFALTRPNITLTVNGTVPPIPVTGFPILSSFIARYLSGQSNNILVSSPLLPSVNAEAIFPAPNPHPKLLRNVTIKNMKIKPTGSTFLASGIVQARVVLPKGINVGLDVFRVLPDVLVFDGEVPSGTDLKRGSRQGNPPPETPLPEPLPEKAFGHIRPEDWLPSLSFPIELDDESEGAAYAVSAKVVDVPLEVLPGRQKEFSNFVGKVIFGTDGATAGILGNVAVTVSVEGLPLHRTPGHDLDEIVLAGLPFQGSVHVGKKGLLRFDSGEEDDKDKSGRGKERQMERWKRTWKKILRKIKEGSPL